MNILDNVTEAQKEAIIHVDGPLLVIAGAGSGKTRVITRRVGYLVEKGTSPSNDFDRLERDMPDLHHGPLDGGFYDRGGPCARPGRGRRDTK